MVWFIAHQTIYITIPFIKIHFMESCLPKKMMERTDLREDQRQLVETSALCQKQILKILDDMDLESIEDGYLDLDTVEFTLGAPICEGKIGVDATEIDKEQRNNDESHHIGGEGSPSSETLCVA